MLPKLKPVQENKKQMLSHKKTAFLSLFAALAVSAGAHAGLYGFDSANPYTFEEEILDIRVPPEVIINYRQKMRDNVIALANYAQAENKNFIIISHDGEDLLHKSLWEYHLEGYNEARKKGINAADPAFLANLKNHDPEREPIAGSQSSQYIRKLNGMVVNNRFCGNTTVSPHLKNSGLKVISIDNCKTEDAYDEAIMNSVGLNYLLYGFVKPENAFKKIYKQPIINENANNIFSLKDAKNISFLIDDSQYGDKEKFLQDIRNSNYDIVVIEPFFQHKTPFSPEDINSLKFKKNGTKRLIIAKMNVSEARDDDYYWKDNWKLDNPSWLVRPSFVDKNAIITEYWNNDWKKIIGKYFKGIVDSGFDGAFLTGIQNHRYFEKQTPLE